MPLLEQETTPQSPDDADRACIKATVKRAYRLLMTERGFLANRVWHQQGRTPQEVFDALGSDACQFLLASRKLDELGALLGDPPPEIVPVGTHLEITAQGRVLVVKD